MDCASPGGASEDAFTDICTNESGRQRGTIQNDIALNGAGIDDGFQHTLVFNCAFITDDQTVIDEGIDGTEVKQGGHATYRANSINVRGDCADILQRAD